MKNEINITVIQVVLIAVGIIAPIALFSLRRFVKQVDLNKEAIEEMKEELTILKTEHNINHKHTVKD